VQTTRELQKVDNINKIEWFHVDVNKKRIHQVTRSTNRNNHWL